MEKKSALWMLVVFMFMVGLAACGGKTDTAKTDKAKAETAAKAKEDEASALAVEAYIYGYPLVTMEVTRRVMTNVSKSEGKLAPMGNSPKLRTYPSPADKEVTAPNADTLYTLAWLDVSREPWVLSIPDMQGRYFLFPMLSGWTDVFQVPGKRTTGTRLQKYTITVRWTGTLPEGVTEYKSPTGRSGSWAAFTARAHPRTTKQYMRSRQGLRGAAQQLRQALTHPPEAKVDRVST